MVVGCGRFGFKVYNYVGGFDEEASDIYGNVHGAYQEFEIRTNTE